MGKFKSSSRNTHRAAGSGSSSNTYDFKDGRSNQSPSKLTVSNSSNDDCNVGGDQDEGGDGAGKDHGTKLKWLITKVLFYSRKSKVEDDVIITSKYAKYLNLLRSHSLLPHSSRADDSVEVLLRKYGALEAILIVVRNIVDSFGHQSQEHEHGSTDAGQQVKKDVISSSEVRLTPRESILSNSLSMLSNSFARDHVARDEAFKNSIILVLNKILKLNNIISQEIQAKTLKCLGNLAVDRQCRVQIFVSGVATNILKPISMIHAKSNDNKVLKSKTPFCSSNTLLTHQELNRPMEQLISNSVRTLRILCADTESKTSLWRLNTLVIVGGALVWVEKQVDKHEGSAINRNLTLEIVKAINALSVKFRISPAEAVFQFKIEGEPLLQILVEILKKCNDKKILSQAVLALTNLAENKEVVPRLINLKIYDVLFIRIGAESDIPTLGELVRLLRGLVMDDGVLCKFLLPYSSHIFTTIKIFRLQELEKYHEFLLSLYKNLLGPALDVLMDNGLVELLEELLQNIYQSCTLKKLRKRISSLDDTSCPVHVQGCKYTPIYRCTSPTYLEVQEEVKEFMMVRACFDDGERFQRKGESSPSHSWSSSGFVSDNSSEVFSASSSGRASPASFSSSDNEDTRQEEMLYSEHRAEFSEPEMDIDDEETLVDDTEQQEQPTKRRRIDDSFESDGKKNTEKMVSIIDILKNITFLKPFRTNLLKFIPTFLNILCDGKLNCMNYVNQNESITDSCPSVALNKPLFYGSHRMLQEFFCDINNFTYILQSNLIPLLHRLVVFGSDKESNNVELQKCNEVLKTLLVALTGETNQTTGWREGFLNQILVSLNNPELKDKVAVAIPLLYQVDCYRFRSFQLKYGAWTTLFRIFEDMQEDNTLFQDCIVSISALCKTLGLKWTEHISYGEKCQLHAPSNNNSPTCSKNDTPDKNNSIIIQLDDGSEISTSKELLTTKSPVFSAMLDGNFLEANEQKVKLPSVSNKALKLLIDELQFSSAGAEVDNFEVKDPKQCTFEIQTLFELLSISNQYMVEEIQNKTLNTLISRCLCPYSAPQIYENIIKTFYDKVGPNNMKDSTELTRLVLKYLLVGDKIGSNLTCYSFKKLFNKIEPSFVLEDLKAYFKSISNNILSTPPPLRRGSGAINFYKLLNPN